MWLWKGTGEEFFSRMNLCSFTLISKAEYYTVNDKITILTTFPNQKILLQIDLKKSFKMNILQYAV